MDERRISDTCFNIDCDLDKLKHMLEGIDDCTSKVQEDIFIYQKLQEEINVYTSICFDYCKKIRDQIHEIDKETEASRNDE